MPKIFRFIAILLMFPMVVSCSTTNTEGTPLPEMTFAHLEPLALDVARIDVRFEEMRSVNDFVEQPEQTIRNYVESRFRPSGTANTLLIRIGKATVDKNYKQSGNQIAKMMKLGGTDSYSVFYRIHLDLFDNSGGLIKGYVVSANRVINVSEHASLLEREKHQMEGVELLFGELDQQIENVLRNEWRMVLLSPPSVQTYP